jgi:hypothetical protein
MSGETRDGGFADLTEAAAHVSTAAELEVRFQ